MGVYNVSIGTRPDITYSLPAGLPSGWTMDSDGWEINSNGLTTKNYPNDYPDDLDSVVIMKASEATSILEFTIPEYALEARGGYPEYTIYDWIEIRDGLNDSAPLIVKLQESSNTPIDIVSTGQYIYILFHSDGSENEKGLAISQVVEKDVNGIPSCTLTQTGVDGIAVSAPYNRLPNEDDIIEINSVLLDMNLENISTSTIADTLDSKNTIKVGYELVIVKDDDSVHTMLVESDPGTLPYSIDVSAITAGEIPSRVFLAEETVQFNNQDIDKGVSSYTDVDITTGKLNCIENFTTLDITTRSVITSIYFKSIGNEMTSLKYDMIKE